MNWESLKGRIHNLSGTEKEGNFMRAAANQVCLLEGREGDELDSGRKKGKRERNKNIG